MSLRKSPKLTSDALTANRRNAPKSTGPRTAAGKARARHNALQHGRRAASDVSRQTMLALGEDPEEFENLYQTLLGAYEPADPLWAKQKAGASGPEQGGPRTINTTGRRHWPLMILFLGQTKPECC